MASPPWAKASSDDQYFVLITGANSGVGMGIGQRTIHEFLASRPPSAHLILLPTTRSKGKSKDTVLALREYLYNAVHTSKTLEARLGASFDREATIARVHILSVQLDLCDLRSVYAAADQLVNGTVSDPTGIISDVTIPRIDAALFNAGIGGWTGVDWLGLAKQFFTVGLVQCTTFPAFKIAQKPAVVLDSKKLVEKCSSKSSLPQLAEVFTANLFGHYLLAHELLPLLSRANKSETPGRVVWTSSIDAEDHGHLDFNDFQASKYMPPYESSKRITDLIVLTADLPSVQEVSTSYFTSPATENRPVKPKFYLSHPGVVCTPIFPLNFFLFFWYWVAMNLSRLCGSPWHTVTIYAGACATSWLGLADQSTLDAQDAERIKWGSSVSRLGHAAPKKTEVQGWGWEGRIEDAEAIKNDTAAGWLRKATGRKWDAVTLTEESRQKFEEDGRRCWEELESLRIAWEEALARRKV
ncbi:hypothetical protein F5Y18DRAFT_386134 [Xylariaceae sp. FL1019]|nr:hypothetical protein F5Y18DRAFT_386134 [Xylariaceae sp. FL1019]